MPGVPQAILTRPAGNTDEGFDLLGEWVAGPYTELLARSAPARQRVPAIESDTPQRYAPPGAFLRSNAEWMAAEHSRTDVARVVRRALTVSRMWRAAMPPGLHQIRDPVVAQGDARVDNMLWDGSRMRLIDFESFGVGDRSCEIADLAEHISARLSGIALSPSRMPLPLRALTPPQCGRGVRRDAQASGR